MSNCIVILVCSIHSTHETIDCFNGFFWREARGQGLSYETLKHTSNYFTLQKIIQLHHGVPVSIITLLFNYKKVFLSTKYLGTYFKISIKCFSFWKRLVWNCIIICTFIFAMDLNFFASYPTFTSLYSMIYTYVFVYSLATSHLVYNLNGNAYHSNVWIRYK